MSLDVKSLGPRVSSATEAANHMRTEKQGEAPRAIDADAKQCPLSLGRYVYFPFFRSSGYSDILTS